MKLLIVKGLTKEKKDYYGVKVVHQFASGKKFTKIVDFITESDYVKAKEVYPVQSDGSLVLLDD